MMAFEYPRIIGLDIYDVWRSVDRVVNWSKQYPDAVRAEHKTLSEAADSLNALLAKLEEKDAA